MSDTPTPEWYIKRPIIVREWLGGREVIDLSTDQGYGYFAEDVTQDYEAADELIEQIVRLDEVIVNEHNERGQYIERYTKIDAETAKAIQDGKV